MRVLLVSQYCPPENAQFPADIANRLRAHGHCVRVVTGYPNYPHGKLFDGYRQRWYQRNYETGIEVIRVPLSEVSLTVSRPPSVVFLGGFSS